MYRLALGVMALFMTVSFVSVSHARDARGERAEDWARLWAAERSRIDVIDLEPRMGRFDKVRIVAVNDDIYVKTVRLVLGRGKTSEVNINKTISKDGSTVVIDLPGDSEAIRSAEVEYKVRLPSKGYVVLEGLVSGMRGGYEVLETAVVDTKDTQVTLNTRGEDTVSSLRLRAWVHPVHVRRAEIVFGNNDRQEVRVRERLDPGEATDPIELDGRRNARYVKSVILTLRAQRGDAERARIDLLGKVEEVDRGRRDRRGRSDGLGRDWKLLGTRRAAVFTKDDDTFRVGRSAGKFKTIRVRARGEDVRMYGMKIRYGNGSVEDVPLYGTLQAGQMTQPFDLKGRNRFIEEISFQYRTKLNFKGEAEVELWGEQAGRG